MTSSTVLDPESGDDSAALAAAIAAGDPAGDPRTIPANSAILQSRELKRLGLALRFAARISPGLAAKTAGALFRRPRRHRQPDRELAWIKDAKRVVLPYQAPQGAGRSAPGELAALSWGAGPTVMLLHGWEGRASQMGGFVDALVARGLRVVALDAPAHGRSGGKASSMIEFGAGLLSAQRELGPLHGVVGHSLGSAATAFAISNGLEVERLAFVSPPFDLDVYFELFLGVLGLSDDVRQRMVRGYERQFGRPWDSLRCATVADAREHELLVLHDRDDQETPFAGAQAVAERWPQGQLHATDGLGHLRILRDREVHGAVARHMAP